MSWGILLGWALVKVPMSDELPPCTDSAGADDILLHVDGGEFLVLDRVGNARGKSRGRDIETGAGGGAVVLNSGIAYTQFPEEIGGERGGQADDGASCG